LGGVDWSKLVSAIVQSQTAIKERAVLVFGARAFQKFSPLHAL